MSRSARAPSPLVAGLHLLALSSFALAQPLFDLLGKNGQFFAARGSTRWEILVFALGITLAPAALLLAVEAVASLVSERLRTAIHLSFVTALVAVIALQALKRLGGPGSLLVALAAVAGVLGAGAYAHRAEVRSVTSALAVAPALFLALFLFHSQATKLTFEGEARAQIAEVRPTPPIVFVVFDELPIASLLDAQHRIDPVRYPHFAELARAATWFRYATTVGEGTLHAVPALLTGRYPRPGELPRYADHPQNLFTLLGRGDAMRVDEAETHLCPARLCPRSGSSFPSRMRALTADLSAVYLHVLLPEDLARDIPSVSNGWQDFWGTTQGLDQNRRFQRFVRALAPSRRPTLHFLHVLLPHSPWQYLPNGRRYQIPAPPGWDIREIWTTNRASVLQYWQRHLLQVGFADRLVGELLARLRATGLYDRALLVVTADEGISFRPGEKRRPAARVNFQDVAYVPLFIKAPEQRQGAIVDRPVQSIDVLPTIARILRIRIPWRVDGRSALDSPSQARRDVVLFKDAGRKLVARSSVLEARLDAALARQHALFGSDESTASLYGVGRYRTLLGKSLSTLDVRTGTGRVRFGRLQGSDPVQVGGRIVNGGAHDVALIVGGRIAAVVPVWKDEFWALLPGSAFRRGPRELSVYSAESRLSAPVLRLLARD